MPDELSIAAAIVRRGDDILMVLQAGAGEEPVWSIPGGRVEPGEFVVDTLVREVREETGVEVVEPGRIAFLAQQDDRQEGYFATIWTWEVASWRGQIAVDDPRAADVQELLGRHLAFAHSQSGPEHVHALAVDGLLDPAISFFSYREAGLLLAVGALKQLEPTHAEIKSMHTAQPARGRGIGRAMLAHLLRLARDRGCRRVSLETGAIPAFAPARALYAGAGFVPCGPFGDYQPMGTSTFMTLELAAGG